MPTAKLDVDGTVNVTGVSTFQSHVHLGDDDELRFGAGNDFKIYHDPDDARIENSNGDIKFKNTGSYFFFDEDGGETLASFINDGAINLFHAGSKKFETTGYGITVFGGVNATGLSTFSDEVSFGSTVTFGTSSQNIKIYNGNTIRETGSGEFRKLLGNKMVLRNSADTKAFAEFVNGDTARLYFNNSAKFQTTGYGVTVFGGVNATGVSTFSDEVSFGSTVTFGTSSQNIKIYTNSNGHSTIQETGGGNLKILGNKMVLKNSDDNRVFAEFFNNSVARIYYNGSKKFETTGVGVSILNGTSETATIYGPSNLIIDPMPVGVGTTSGIVRIKGDLYVDGTTTQINSTSLEIADFIVGIASTATTDLLADGAGIGIGTNKTFLYEHNSGTNPSLKLVRT